MMPGAGSFLLPHVRPFILLYLARWEMGASRLQSVTKSRCSPHPPRGPLFVVVYLYAAPQHLGFRVGVPDRGFRAFSNLIGPGLCRIVDMNFRECPF